LRRESRVEGQKSKRRGADRRLPDPVEAVCTDGENEIVITPNLEVHAVGIINAGSIKAPCSGFYEFKP
jgi:hypothetical protein